MTDHKDSEVTALAWSMDGTTVFSGDDAGSVMGSIISKGIRMNTKGVGKNIKGI